MNYHLMVDDKFINKFIESAEKVAQGNNVYIITSSLPTRFVTSNNAIYALPFSKKFNSVIDEIRASDRLYIHWFDKYQVDLVEKIPSGVMIFLFFWGGDFLQQTKAFRHFNFDPYSKRYLQRIERKSLFNFTINVIHYLKLVNRFIIFQKKKNISEKIEIKAREQFLDRLNYFCHWNALDMDIVVVAYGGCPKFAHFIYDVSLGSIDKPLPRTNKSNLIKLWLGNSDDPTNNHLDAINCLKRYKSQNVEVYCPLNYENGDYAKYVTKIGLKYFNERWHSITEFVPIEQYLQLLEKMDVVIMYHNLTQAAGNIFSFVKMGKKVFMKSQSTIYALLVKNGVKVFDANTIPELTFEEFTKPLSSEEVHFNFNTISELFSDERRLQSLSKILN